MSGGLDSDAAAADVLAQRARGRRKKKERSGLQSARDELIDKGAFITGEVGCMRPELGEFIQ